MELSAYGITTQLLPGFEGRITKRTQPAGNAVGPSGNRARGTSGEVPNPVVHLANFALPENRGDYGSGAVDLMGAGHLFLCLFEYGPASVGQPLFARQGIPTNLAARQFSANGLQRAVPGQAGTQSWFTESGRPFCLYVVLGRRQDAPSLAPVANRALIATRIEPR